MGGDGIVDPHRPPFILGVRQRGRHYDVMLNGQFVVTVNTFNQAVEAKRQLRSILTKTFNLTEGKE